MGRGIIGTPTLPEIIRSERVEIQQRTSDPDNFEPNEEWLRVDIKPSYEDADGNTQTGVAEYRIGNADGTVDTAPVAALGHKTGSNVIDKDRVYVDAGGSPTGIGFIPNATSGATYPSRKLEHPVDGQVAMHDALTANAIPDSVVSRTGDNNSNSFDNNVGVIISTSQNWESIQARISSNHSTASDEEMVLQDSGGTELASVDISNSVAGDVITFSGVNLSENSEYNIFCRTSNSRSYGYYDSPSFPYDSADGNLSITAGYANGSNVSDTVYAIDKIGNINL